MVKSFSDQELKPGTFVVYGPCCGGLTFSMYVGVKAKEETRYNYTTRTREKVVVDRPVFLQCLVETTYDKDADGKYIRDESTGRLKVSVTRRRFRECSTMYGYRAMPIPDEMVPEDTRKAYREVYPGGTKCG